MLVYFQQDSVVPLGSSALLLVVCRHRQRDWQLHLSIIRYHSWFQAVRKSAGLQQRQISSAEEVVERSQFRKQLMSNSLRKIGGQEQQITTTILIMTIVNNAASPINKSPSKRSLQLQVPPIARLYPSSI